MKLIYILTLTTFTLFINNITFAQCDWSKKGLSVGNLKNTLSITSVTTDSLGTPYVAYADKLNGDKIVVKKYNGSSWVMVGGVVSTLFSRNPKIVTAPDGSIYVAYSDDGSPYEGHVKKFDGTSWINVGGASISSNYANYIDLTFDALGTPYLAYTSSTLLVMKFNGTSWINVGGAVSNGSGNYPHIAVSSAGIPYVIYTSAAALGYISVVSQFNGTAWVTISSPTGLTPGRTFSTGIAITTTGIPYVAVSDSSRGYKAVVMQYDGNNWLNVGTPGFGVTSASYLDFKMNTNNTPYICYGGTNNVMKFDGTAWVSVGSTNFSGSCTNLTMTIANDTSIFVSNNAFNGGTGNTVDVYAISNKSGVYNINQTLCAGQSLTVGTNTYTSTGTYTDVLTGVSGCDSTVITNLTINAPIDITTFVTGLTITASQTNASYQWIDCVNSTLISNANSSSYTTTTNGNYAVIITVGNCSDTSSCVAISTVGIKNSLTTNELSIYPNPSNGNFWINTSLSINKIEIYTMQGQLVNTIIEPQLKQEINLTNYDKGIYIIKCTSNTNSYIKRVVYQ